MLILHRLWVWGVKEVLGPNKSIPDADTINRKLSKPIGIPNIYLGMVEGMVKYGSELEKIKPNGRHI